MRSCSRLVFSSLFFSLGRGQILTYVREALPAWRPLPDSDIELKQVRRGFVVMYRMDTVDDRQHAVNCLLLGLKFIFTSSVDLYS